MKLRVISPEGERLDVETSLVQLVTTEGSLGILDGHEDFICLLADQAVEYEQGKESLSIEVSSAICQISPQEVLIVSET